MNKQMNKVTARRAGKYTFSCVGGRYNGRVHFWNQEKNELTDTQEAQLHLDIESALNEHAALVEVIESRCPYHGKGFDVDKCGYCQQEQRALANLAAVRK